MPSDIVTSFQVVLFVCLSAIRLLKTIDARFQFQPLTMADLYYYTSSRPSRGQHDVHDAVVNNHCLCHCHRFHFYSKDYLIN